ncbi:MAG: penicillin-binding protein activator [Marinobacter sp.]|nr:penicillin-binding protein activator [Marinobacter sp.]
MKANMPQAITHVALICVMLILSGCAAMRSQPESPSSAQEALAAVERLSDREAAQRYLLRAADYFQSRNEHREARDILTHQQLAAPLESLEDQYRLQSLISMIALGDIQWARRTAPQLPIDQFSRYPIPELRERALELQLALYDLARDHVRAALTIMAQADIGEPLADQQVLHDRIWQSLRRATTRALIAADDQVVGYEAQGWLELAAMMRAPGLTLEQQGETIRMWQQRWEDHSASNMLPAELALVITLVQQRPERIALALPLSGNLREAGNAIRDGFMTAYFLDGNRAEFDIDIRVYDTEPGSFTELFEQIVRDQPDLVVGPLERPKLASLAGLESLPMPVLALNYLEQGTQAPPQLHQFGLAAEDEARQIADRILAENLSQAVALIPFGDWGNRVEQALAERMAEQGGIVLQIARYTSNENLRTLVANLLDISASRQRAADIQRTVGQRLEFEPRRRQDIDAIVMVANPTVGRQLKPLFAFYFAGDLPVYSTSLVYSGAPDPGRDSDLNDVRFTDIPWLLDTDSSLRKQTNEAFGTRSGHYQRLFAMGIDAYQLSTQLPLLRQVPDSALQGHTGVLTMDSDGRVTRTQGWAQFRRGQPVLLAPLPTTRETTETDESEDANF